MQSSFSAASTTPTARVSLLPEHFPWVIGSLCQLHKIPFDAGLLLTRFAPLKTHSLLAAATEAGMKCELRASAAGRRDHLHHRHGRQCRHRHHEHCVESLDVSTSLSFTNFNAPNRSSVDYPR